MGQYYVICNLDKRQMLTPHKLGDGSKLLEFGCSPDGTMAGLAILLADGNGRGGGDLRSKNPIIGTWAGDRIVIAGHYADDGKFLDGATDHNLFSYAKENFEDISWQVRAALEDDGSIELRESW